MDSRLRKGCSKGKTPDGKGNKQVNIYKSLVFFFFRCNVIPFSIQSASNKRDGTVFT